MTDTTAYPGVSEKEIEAQRARYITRPSRPTPFLAAARGPATRMRALLTLVATLAVVAAVWGLWFLLGVPAFVDILDGAFRRSHAVNRNGLCTAHDFVVVTASYAGTYAVFRLLGQVRRRIYRNTPQRIVKPLPWEAVDVESDLGREHRALLVGLRDRSTTAGRDDGSTCATSRRLLWDLAVAARIHRQLVLDTIARPELTVAHDPRPKLLEDLQEQIDFLAAVVDTGLAAPDRCMCAHSTWTLAEQLATATQRAAALIPDRGRSAWAGQR